MGAPTDYSGVRPFSSSLFDLPFDLRTVPCVFGRWARVVATGALGDSDGALDGGLVTVDLHTLGVGRRNHSRTLNNLYV